MKQLILKEENYLAITNQRTYEYEKLGPCPNFMYSESEWIDPSPARVLSKKELEKFLKAKSNRKKEKILKKAVPLRKGVYYEGFVIPYNMENRRITYIMGFPGEKVTFFKELVSFKELSLPGSGDWDDYINDKLVEKLKRKLFSATFIKRRKFWVTHLEYLMLEKAGYLPLFEVIRSVDFFSSKKSIVDVRFFWL